MKAARVKGQYGTAPAGKYWTVEVQIHDYDGKFQGKCAYFIRAPNVAAAKQRALDLAAMACLSAKCTHGPTTIGKRGIAI